jgi:hypothetical protein
MGQLLKGWKRKTAFTLIAVSIGAFTVWRVAAAYYTSIYPFGPSHCCDKILYFQLLEYADKNGGAFPAGESSPEASLSLLHKSVKADANLLRGKSVPEAVVKEILDRGELLGPESCGWHYVEGLHKDDNGRLAIFWDKEGLGHNGQKLAGGGHIVWFLDSNHPHITADKWPQFLAEQAELNKQRGITKVEPESD